MKKIVIIVMHGMKPKDFPVEEKKEYMKLRRENTQPVPARLIELEKNIREWPRTETNDPYYCGSIKIGKELEKNLGLTVIVSFNESCAPSVDQAIDKAVEAGATHIAVTTPMLTPGGHHAEEEIPEIIKESQIKYPDIPIEYAWPPKIEKIAQFLAELITDR